MSTIFQDKSTFLNLLFDFGDETCFSPDPYGVNSTPIYEDRGPWLQPLFCINALEGRRADKNVVKHRTFLVEFDSLPLEEQDAAMTLPHTARVYSGGKSFHFFICLEEPVSAEEYAELAQRIHMAVPLADKSTKNPSRLARMAGSMRDNGRLQALMRAGSRINKKDLEACLPPLPVPVPFNEADRALFISTAILAAKHAPDEVMEQMKITGRNNFFHWLGQRLLEHKLDKAQRRTVIDMAYANLRHKTGFSLREARNAARV